MFLVCMNPTEFDMAQNDTIYCAQNETQLKIRMDLLAARYPNSSILIFKLDKRVLTKCEIQYTSYKYNDKGELLPE